MQLYHFYEKKNDLYDALEGVHLPLRRKRRELLAISGYSFKE